MFIANAGSVETCHKYCGGIDSTPHLTSHLYPPPLTSPPPLTRQGGGGVKEPSMQMGRRRRKNLVSTVTQHVVGTQHADWYINQTNVW